jgi:hypothetical protein
MAKNKNHIYKELSKNELLKLRDEAVRKEFDKHTKEKHLDANYVLHEILQKKFFLDTDCLWRIVRGTYVKKYNKN